MKFGGTSVGDATCIRKVVDIIRAASRGSNLVVVVSAMSGVTNKLIEAAARAEAGDWEAVAAIFAQLRKQRGTNSVYHNNSIQTWQVKPDGSVFDVQLA